MNQNNLSSVDDDDKFKFFSCGICNQVYNEPVTLLCQHTFCRSCLQEMVRVKEPENTGPIPIQELYNPRQKNKCPLCDLPFVIPPKSVNFVINDFIEDNLTEEQRTERKREALKRSMEEEVRDELKEELYQAVVEQLNKERKLDPVPKQDKMKWISGPMDLNHMLGMSPLGGGSGLCHCPDCDMLDNKVDKLNKFLPLNLNNKPKLETVSYLTTVTNTLKNYLPRNLTELTSAGMLITLCYFLYRSDKFIKH